MTSQLHLDRTKAQRKSVTRTMANVREIGRELRDRRDDGLAVIELAGAADALREAENFLLSAETHLQDGASTGRPAA